MSDQYDPAFQAFMAKLETMGITPPYNVHDMRAAYLEGINQQMKSGDA